MTATLGFLRAAAEHKARYERLRPLCTASQWAAASRLAHESPLNIEQAVAVTLRWAPLVPSPLDLIADVEAPQ